MTVRFGKLHTEPDGFLPTWDRRSVPVFRVERTGRGGPVRNLLGELVKLGRGRTQWQATTPLRSHLPRPAPKYFSADLRSAKSQVRKLLDHG